ncbi:signal transduction histidine kinase [Paenibacillus castaneae]|uniref:sensor histidine kinase n=1 Tax=Paenibacillus castaneae TaxID=474957 RepID=UPI000C9D1527|nr:HAMP domain-containing sensor histidine kinase [Paenibacillus castaneae]NIK75345.1 signal transduction histidine kinase [Paenibacillus castaneae]
MKHFLTGTRFVLFLIFICLSAILLSAMYYGDLGLKERSLLEYRKQYYDDQSRKLAYALQTHIQTESLSDYDIQLLNDFSAVYSFAIRYYAPDGNTLLFESMNKHPEVVERYEFEVPIMVKGDLVGYVRSYFDLSKKSPSYYPGSEMESSQGSSIIFAWLLIFSVLLSFFMAKRLSRSVIASSKVADLITNGIRGTEIPVTGTSEMKQLANTINTLVADFKRHEDWQKQMMQDLAHEIRTPLTSLHSRIEAIIDGIHPATEENWYKIHTEIDRLCRLLDDLEKLSEAESARFQLNIQRVDMTELLRDVYEGFLYMGKGKGIRLNFQKPYLPCYAEVDPDRIIQILSNLLSNAIKYTPSGGTVEIGLNLTGNEIVIYCKDNGIGISEQDLSSIFNRFYRVDKSRTRKNGSGGIGVGLSIAKVLVDAHGGNLAVESTLGEGSRFYFNIFSGGD